MKAEFYLENIKLLELEATGKILFIVPLGCLSVPPFGSCTSGENKSSGHKVARSVWFYDRTNSTLENS